MTRVIYVDALEGGGRRTRNRPRQRAKEKGPRWRPVLLRLALLAVLSALGVGLFMLRVDRVQVYGARLADAEGLRTALAPCLGARLLPLDVESLRQRIVADPWVDRVRIRRRLPGRLVVTVHEARPLWRLPDGGALDGRSRRLPARATLHLEHLPLVEGWPAPGGARDRAARRLALLADALPEVPWGWGGGLASVRLEPGGQLVLHTRSGVELCLGRGGDDAARLRAYAAVEERLDPRAGDRVDLRFAKQVVLAPQAARRAARGG